MPKTPLESLWSLPFIFLDLLLLLTIACFVPPFPKSLDPIQYKMNIMIRVQLYQWFSSIFTGYVNHEIIIITASATACADFRC